MIWSWYRRIPPWIVDGVIVCAVLAVTLGQAVHERGAGRMPVGLALAETLPLLVRRRWPVPVLGISAAVWLAWYASDRATNPAPLLVGLYTVAAHERRRTSVLAAAPIAVVALVTGPRHNLGELAGRLIILAAAWILGDNLRTRRAYLRELELRADRLEREREENVRRATAEEQARIARELHDVIAHNVSVMVVQAAAGNDVFETRPERARDALRSIEATGRAALTELRRLLEVVRTPAGDAFAPQPGLGLLGTLVEQVRAAGLPVELWLEGRLDDLPAGVDLSAYRIVQEALTNTLKHADATAACVSVRRLPSELELEVTDDGGAASAANGGGQGLIGMRERVALFGGRLEAGPGARGGFVVRAVFPLTAER